jgi:predicted nucleic acid-binding protein
MYIDTSLLVPYYCPEILSRRAEQVLRSDAHPVISDLVEVEFFSALAKKVRGREMPAVDATRAGERFLEHLHAAMYTRVAVERRHWEAARDWLARFVSPLRAPDALHLAVADGEGLRLATADADLARSARRFGVNVMLVRARRARA